ncbi:MAG TPA: DUF523 domain-containing protein [Vicinamibacterales bacterium]|nr:DUF523 domain-containing protein [Vicinamibacterales bacterium]
MKPRVGISSCLLGQAVRHDGGHKRDESLIADLEPHVEWVPVCPEIEIGLGTPRPPIELQDIGGAIRLIMPSTGRDLTGVMREYAERKVEALADMRLAGYVLKSRSPSCGLGSTPVVNSSAGRDELNSGVFAAVLRARLPGLPIEEETRLRDAAARDSFLQRILSYSPGRNM